MVQALSIRESATDHAAPRRLPSNFNFAFKTKDLFNLSLHVTYSL